MSGEPAVTRGLVTVVIPTRNRAAVLPRAIRSVLGQSHGQLEIIVIDDASDDDTRQVVESFADPRIRYIRCDTPRNAAAARNTGLDAATGSVVAFLDSDDEWLPFHLQRRLSLMEETGAAGVAGGFYMMRGGRRSERCCPARPASMSMAEYILSGRGDARSSTLVFARDALATVRFDPALRKHQDWDVACRFARGHSLLMDTVSTAVLHEGGGRMTDRLDHDATLTFLARHEVDVGKRTAARFYCVLALRTLRLEGRSAPMLDYLRHARAAGGSWRIRAACTALRVPGVDRAFARTQRGYVELKRRIRPVGRC
jgi:glycosyltransferase involved in cell wall biosynthesis